MAWNLGISLKALASKVLQGNRKGNPVETAKKLVAEGKIKPAAEEPLTGYELAERMAIQGENTEPEQTQPFVDKSGVLVIPFNSPARYHYWKPGGQSVCQTLKELGRCDLIPKYKSLYSDN